MFCTSRVVERESPGFGGIGGALTVSSRVGTTVSLERRLNA